MTRYFACQCRATEHAIPCGISHACMSYVMCCAGSTLFNSLCIASYNALLFIPIVSFILNKDISFETALMNPQLYAECAQSKQFNARTFMMWVGRAVLQAITVFIIAIYSWGSDFVGGK